MKKDEYIIGVSAFYHDSSACLFKNGKAEIENIKDILN